MIQEEFSIMKKNLIVLALGLVLAFSLAACGSDSNESSTASTDSFKGDYVVNADYAKKHADDAIIVDARGVDAANKKTIKGAVALDWQTISKCADRKSGEAGFSCILDAPELATVLGENGIDKNKEIILFSSAQDGWGEDGRIAWELIAAGYKDVKIVNGGFNAMKDAGFKTQKGGTKLDKVSVTIDSLNTDHMINTDELVTDYSKYKIVDVRSDKEYDGATDYGEAKGGHLPDAIHIKYTDLFEKDGTLKSNKDIEKMFKKAGLSKDDQIVTYCTAGIRSAYMQLIMQQCGYKHVKNYDESYYRWCATQSVEK